MYKIRWLPQQEVQELERKCWFWPCGAVHIFRSGLRNGDSAELEERIPLRPVCCNSKGNFKGCILVSRVPTVPSSAPTLHTYVRRFRSMSLSSIIVRSEDGPG